MIATGNLQHGLTKLGVHPWGIGGRECPSCPGLSLPSWMSLAPLGIAVITIFLPTCKKWVFLFSSVILTQCCFALFCGEASEISPWSCNFTFLPQGSHTSTDHRAKRLATAALGWVHLSSQWHQLLPTCSLVSPQVTRCIIEVLSNALSKSNAPPITPECRQILKKSKCPTLQEICVPQLALPPAPSTSPSTLPPNGRVQGRA